MEDVSTTYTSFLTPGKKRALYRNREDTLLSNTVYKEYPPTMPFINDEYRRAPNQPISSYPENNRKAVVDALKNLQGKIRKLELERSAAEDNLKSLATETTKYRDILEKEHEHQEASQTQVSKNTQELESQLSSAETRCNLLEKQLDYMRKMLHNAEVDRQDAVARTLQLETKNTDNLPTENRLHTDKISELEREHLKLSATQTLAESKIRDLEERLKEERHHRKLIEEKAVEAAILEEQQLHFKPNDHRTNGLEAVAQTNRMLLQSAPRPVTKSKKSTKKKKKIVSSKKSRPSSAEPSKHYRLNLAEIPFVAGTSVSQSHSVGANVQRVLSMMKRHNMALCSSACGDVHNHHRSSSPSSGSSSSNGLDNDLAELLLQLQDEFGQMSFEHQELNKQINDATDPRVRDDLERELDSLVSRMEAKSHQISKVRQHQQKLDEKKKKKKPIKTSSVEDPHPRPKSALAGYPGSSDSRNGEVEVTTTIKTKGKGRGVVRIRPNSAREVSLNVLRDMKKLQTTLRKDDVTWE